MLTVLVLVVTWQLRILGGESMRLWTTSPTACVERAAATRRRRSDWLLSRPGYRWCRGQAKWPWLDALDWRRRGRRVHGRVFVEQLEPGSVAWTTQRVQLREPYRRPELGAWAERRWMRMRWDMPTTRPSLDTPRPHRHTTCAGVL